MSISYLNITVRRKDKTPVTRDDLERFDEYFFGDFGAYESCSTISPYICNDGIHIFASCEARWGYDERAMKLFASENPHLQIEIMEEYTDGDYSNFRHLYEGDLYEMCEEVRYFEQPKLIDWKEGA